MRILKIALRLIVAVLSISLVVFILSAGFWYTWQYATGYTPETRYEITAEKLDQLGHAIQHLGHGVSLWYRADEVAQPVDPNDDSEVVFVVQMGESAGTVAYRLESMGLVSDAELFRRVLQYWEADDNIQTGVYTLSPSMKMEEIMQELQHGKMPSVLVTIPEGWRAEQVAELLETNKVVEAEPFLAMVHTRQAPHPIDDATVPSLEGFLFPDTYQLPQHTTPQKVLEIMLRNWDSRVPQELRELVSEQDMTLYEAITLASIVEREAVLKEEQPIIAGVYLNRLDQGMYLQSDPTVQYAKDYDEASDRWWGTMLQEEAVTVQSDYNTFLNPGLPPSPICNPGLDAIRAVLEPEETDYLFFYARGDGSHEFAETYEEHLKNQEQYTGEIESQASD